MKKNMHVYIITKEGKAYNKEGLEILKTNLSKNGCTNPTFIMGQTTNNSKVLAAAIKENPNRIHIVLSHKTGVIGIPTKAYDDIYYNLINNPNDTSYECLVKTYKLEP